MLLWRAFAIRNERTCQRSSSRVDYSKRACGTKDGFVTTIRGKGTFVKEQDSSILKEKQFFTIENLVKELVNEAQAIEMSLENSRYFNVHL